MPSLPRSLPRICVALGFRNASELIRAAEREYKDGNTFLEFRLDYLDDPASGVQALQKIKVKHPELQILATCRHKEHQGHFKGPIEAQIKLLEDAARAGAMAIDLEIESAECVQGSLQKLRSVAPLIVSFHDFQGTPALSAVMRRLQRVPADAYKVAVTARKPGDNLRLIQLLRDARNTPLIAFNMSDIGMPTRILSPSLGSVFTYAAPADAEGTAPGQIPAKTMRMLYRTDKLAKETRVYGIIADPVSHSKSPLIHNRAFQARRCNSVYLPFLVPSVQLGDWMKLAGELPVAGFSVTIPHKQKILRYLDVVEPLAKRIGAVNTVWRKAGKWRGTNTDVQGVLQPLAKHMRLSRSSILIAGYGGAARAAAIALADEGAKITITGRNLTSAQALARVVKADAVSREAAERNHFDALIHATPVGMTPNSNAALFENVPADVVLDMVYNPHETLLLKRAKEQGRTIVYGAEMLLEQAVRQFEIWTGEPAPRAVMQSALEQHL
jgi:3-dehydroquinate dehydratase / shikimate dehydrogenase